MNFVILFESLVNKMIAKESKILVTGATGLVGSNIIRLLVRNGYNNVYALIRKSSRTELIKDILDVIEIAEGDLSDIVSLDSLLENIDIVIHSAAMVSFRKKDRKSLLHVNVEGTANLLNICLEKKIKRFIHISSIAALGRKESGKMIDENCQWEASDINSDYAISKYLAEMEVWRAFAEGMPVAIINPSNILGAGFWNNGTGEIFHRINHGLSFYPTGTNGFVDVRDVASMTVKLMESDITGERFICSAENVKHKDIITKIAKGLGKNPPTVKLTKGIIRISSFFIDFYNILTSGKSNLSSQSLKNASFDSYYDNSKSTGSFEFQYTPIEKTIIDTCSSYIESAGKGLDYGVFK